MARFVTFCVLDRLSSECSIQHKLHNYMEPVARLKHSVLLTSYQVSVACSINLCGANGKTYPNNCYARWGICCSVSCAMFSAKHCLLFHICVPYACSVPCFFKCNDYVALFLWTRSLKKNFALFVQCITFCRLLYFVYCFTWSREVHHL